jgi:hypothetical protein
MEKQINTPLSIRKQPTPSRICRLRSATIAGSVTGAGALGGGGGGDTFLVLLVVAIGVLMNAKVQYSPVKKPLCPHVSSIYVLPTPQNRYLCA